MNDPSKLVIRAYVGEQGRVKTYLVVDFASGTVGIAADGSLYQSTPSNNQSSAQTGTLITPNRVVASLATEVGQDLSALETAAARVNAALEKLMGVAGTVKA